MTSKQQDIEAIARAIYESAQSENGNLSALPWRIVKDGETAARWRTHAQAAFAVMSERMGAALSDDALKPVLREMYARTAEAWPAAPAWAGKAYREGERDDILFDHGLPVLRAAIDATLTRQSGATDEE